MNQSRNQKQPHGTADKRRSPWPYAIVAAFVVQSCVLATTMVLALRTPANAEPGYYDKALAWNDHAAALAVPRQAGWRAEASAHARTVTLSLADARGNPIANAAVTATAFHRTSALDRHATDFVETAPGVYRAPIPAADPGLWEFRFAIDAPGSPPAALTRTVETD